MLFRAIFLWPRPFRADWRGLHIRMGTHTNEDFIHILSVSQCGSTSTYAAPLCLSMDKPVPWSNRTYRLKFFCIRESPASRALYQSTHGRGEKVCMQKAKANNRSRYATACISVTYKAYVWIKGDSQKLIDKVWTENCWFVWKALWCGSPHAHAPPLY